METLKYVFTLMADWLKFAETKNAAIIAFNGSVLLAIVGFSPTIFNFHGCYQLAFLSLFVGNFLSLFFALWAVRSRISPDTKGNKTYQGTDNLFFFADIYNFKEEEYLKALKDKYEIADIDPTKPLFLSMAKQIIVNAGIANIKFNCFWWAWFFTSLGILLSAILAVIAAVGITFFTVKNS